MAADVAHSFKSLLSEVRACDICQYHLQLPPKPVVQLHPQARILIIAQAPGTRARTSGKPFDDRSGIRLRNWLSVTRETFYDETKFAMMPMGFCYPGKTKSGDLPPCKECAPLWHPRIMPHLSQVALTLFVGSYAQKYYLNGTSVEKTVKNWQEHWPKLAALPHPSWHNNAWLVKNPWFEQKFIPQLQQRVAELLTP